jgi:hypothetical protein
MGITHLPSLGVYNAMKTRGPSRAGCRPEEDIALACSGTLGAGLGRTSVASSHQRQIFRILGTANFLASFDKEAVETRFLNP